LTVQLPPYPHSSGYKGSFSNSQGSVTKGSTDAGQVSLVT
jgi:hypothetical protein